MLTGKAILHYIPEGTLFVMTGDQVHSGFHFLAPNYRIHWYLEYPCLTTSDANQTGYVDWDSKTNTFVFKCKTRSAI